MKTFTAALSLTILLLASRASAQAPGLSPFTRQYLQEPVTAASTTPRPGYVYKRDAAGHLLLSAFLQVAPQFSEEALIPLGVRIGTKAGSVWTAQIPVENLRALTQIAGLRYIQLDEPVTPQLDSARRTTRVDSVQAGFGLPQAFTGEGVVVGIIDAGFDYSHPTLFDTTGVGYRVRKVWEQKVSGTPPAGYAYGRELTDSTALWAAGTDLNISHGAHVAGTAAGSGARNPGGSARFRGMAYRSDLVLVGITPSPQNWTSTGMTDIIDGMAYIFSYAASVGKPAVVNLSWGCTIGPHDGASLFSLACDALTGPGKIFCLSAGNNGTNTIHLSKTFTATDTLLRSFVTFPTSLLPEKRTWIDLWGDTAQTFCTRITLFNSGARVDSTLLICADGSSHTLRLIGSDGDTCFVTASTEAPSFNGKPRVFLNLYNKSVNPVCLSVKSSNGTADAWMGYVEGTVGHYGGFSFGGVGSVAGNNAMTVGDMASTKSAIAVGAYASKTAAVNVSGNTLNYSNYVTLGNIAPFSSRGPAADGRVKPDITGPGMTLASAISSYDPDFTSTGVNYDLVVDTATQPANGRTYSYAVLYGTSMSSPAVAGIVALLLQAAPSLTPAQVKAALTATAINDTYTGTLPVGGNNIWGAGKVNAYGALKRVLEIAAGVQDVGTPTLACLLFPNPGRGQFSLEVGGRMPDILRISVQDMRGRELRREVWQTSAGQRIKTFDWSGLAPGAYFVRVEGGAQSATMRMVVR